MIWFLAGSETICFILSYRIQPNTYPQCQMDLALAIMHVRAHARQYGIDENRILVVGASAGGHLCASTAMLHEELKNRNFLCASGAGKTIWKDFCAAGRGRTVVPGDQFYFGIS